MDMQPNHLRPRWDVLRDTRFKITSRGNRREHRHFGDPNPAQYAHDYVLSATLIISKNPCGLQACDVPNAEKRGSGAYRSTGIVTEVLAGASHSKCG